MHLGRKPKSHAWKHIPKTKAPLPHNRNQLYGTAGTKENWQSRCNAWCIHLQQPLLSLRSATSTSTTLPIATRDGIPNTRVKKNVSSWNQIILFHLRDRTKIAGSFRIGLFRFCCSCCDLLQLVSVYVVCLWFEVVLGIKLTGVGGLGLLVFLRREVLMQ